MPRQTFERGVVYPPEPPPCVEYQYMRSPRSDPVGFVLDCAELLANGHRSDILAAFASAWSPRLRAAWEIYERRHGRSRPYPVSNLWEPKGD